MNSEQATRVLVVDDEEDVRMVVGLNLDLAGLHYGEAADGVEALEMLNTGEWDGCVLDLTMPNSDGFEVLRALRASGQLDDLGIVVLSANGAPTTAIAALRLGAHAHLSKPFSPTAVAGLVQELVGLKPREREGRRQQMIDRASDLQRLGMKRV